MGTAPGDGLTERRGRGGAARVDETVAMADRHVGAATPVVALLCPEARLRRILRLALRADGYDVVEWGDASTPPSAPPVDAVVVDLDGLRCRPPAAIAALRARGVEDATALLLISVYPSEPDCPERAGPLDYLQPPFALQEFAGRVGRLLVNAGSPAPGPDRMTGL